MKVKELIDILQKIDGELPVEIENAPHELNAIRVFVNDCKVEICNR